MTRRSGVAAAVLAGAGLLWGEGALADHHYNGPQGGFYGGISNPRVSLFVPSVRYSPGPPDYHPGAPAYRYRGYEPELYRYSYPYRWQYRYGPNR